MTSRDAISWASARLISSPNSSLYIAMNSSKSASGIRRYFGNILVKRYCRASGAHSHASLPSWQMVLWTNARRPPFRTDARSRQSQYLHRRVIPRSESQCTSSGRCYNSSHNYGKEL